MTLGVKSSTSALWLNFFCCCSVSGLALKFSVVVGWWHSPGLSWRFLSSFSYFQFTDRPQDGLKMICWSHFLTSDCSDHVFESRILYLGKHTRALYYQERSQFIAFITCYSETSNNRTHPTQIFN